jgi:hypothetical protein
MFIARATRKQDCSTIHKRYSQPVIGASVAQKIYGQGAVGQLDLGRVLW